MRRAAREILRTGAHGIKIMGGGGCMSPTDELEHTQFTVEEIAAACYEATARRKITLAHVYTPQGILNAVRACVRSIEHGNARAAGLEICSGSDVLASMQPFEAMELSLVPGRLRVSA